MTSSGAGLGRRGFLGQFAATGALALGAGCAHRVDTLSESAHAIGLPIASAAAAGFQPTALGELRTGLHGLVEAGVMAGAVTLIARRGRIVMLDAYGLANMATGEAMAPTTIFRIASLTKPIIALAMMQLWEEGRWRLDDPLDAHIPEFADLRMRTASGELVPPPTRPTMAELMTHTAGFGDSRYYAQARLFEGALADMIGKLAAAPLANAPGSDWVYGPGADIEAYLIEKLSGAPLEIYLEEKVFAPLGMRDTGFWVSEADAPRVAAVHDQGEDGRAVASPRHRVATQRPRFLSGSGGLFSTAPDYWRFAQALANGGTLNGRRIAEADTIAMIRTNALAPGMAVDPGGITLPGAGFGLGVAVVVDAAAAGSLQSEGSFYWAGSFGSWFWVDSARELVFVAMMSRSAGPAPQALALQLTGTYAALEQ